MTDGLKTELKVNYSGHKLHTCMIDGLNTELKVCYSSYDVINEVLPASE